MPATGKYTDGFGQVPQATHETVVVDGVLRYPPTGLKVLVVGGGPGGYFTALECWRKGHDVELLEKNGANSPIGDIVFLSPSGWSTLKNYPSMLKPYQECSWDCFTTYRQLNGELVAPPLDFEWNRPNISQHAAWPLRVQAMVSRAGMTSMFYDQCTRLGIRVTFGANVVDYIEDTVEKTATVITEDGSRFVADIVVAADGLGTKSHMAIVGQPLRAVPTGYVVVRVFYRLDGIKNALLLAKLKHLKRPDFRVYSGDDFHCVAVAAKDSIVIGLTTKPKCRTSKTGIVEMIRNIPNNKLTSWQLCWRDLQSKWTSSGARIIQLGDSAHAFIPTSIMGATTALEDAQSPPECLRLAGRKNANLVINPSFQRVSVLQRLGFANRREMHCQGGMDEAMRNMTAGGPLGMARWIWTHNPEEYAKEKFADALAHLETKTPLEHTNIPKGFKWEPWTVEEELKREREGIAPDLKLNGDWSVY
ncbi:hypothetical protein N7463_007006 [Penicillium fimorum]|uniref:FAD-binding domain-containing protein n=1 Tax=Penicillium fimorum TaxID=1882269 RepID=A0A9W9XVL2_9EURO|nr:hypothetical protein N7463_007006 [Penicillium fimorum]